jgi:hypothetical protein
MDIHDVQDWIKTAPLQSLQEVIWFAEGVLAARSPNGRKKRVDAGKPRKQNTPELFGNVTEPEDAE